MPVNATPIGVTLFLRAELNLFYAPDELFYWTEEYYEKVHAWEERGEIWRPPSP